MSQLFHLTRPDFMLPVLTDEKRHVSTIPAEKIPTIMWPDGRWCFPANLYMLSLFKRGLSRKGRGGTLAAYAASLIPLLDIVSHEGSNSMNYRTGSSQIL